jgi:capsular exopolysaccharide synthesis family protein
MADKNIPLKNSYGKAEDNTNFIINEAYKTIRTNLLLSVIKKGCKTIIVSSSLPGEGKTTTAVNIAISLAQTDKKILLIDADLRKPRIHSIMNLPNTPGLTNVLSNLSSFDKALNKTEYGNLNILCSGITVPNPSEMLANEAIYDLISGLENSYEYIIIDTPPINIVADALPLIKKSDGVLLVVSPRYTTHIEIQKTIKNLEFIDAKIIGFIFNNAVQDKVNKYNYKYKYNTYIKKNYNIADNRI